MDLEMVRRGLSSTRTEAASAIRSGKVAVRGRADLKAGSLIHPGEHIALAAPARRFVSRGGDKLDAALDRFGVVVAGRQALDAGASTGGFTDCLLRRGARHVVALDVGYGQLAWELRQDPRVTVIERTNVRDVEPGRLPYLAELVTADLSFISLRVVLPALTRCSASGADLMLLVKPQFEAGREEVSHRGVVSKPEVWRRVLQSILDACIREGLTPRAIAPSVLRGPAGNVEFFLHATKGRQEDARARSDSVAHSGSNAHEASTNDGEPPEPAPDVEPAVTEAALLLERDA